MSCSKLQPLPVSSWLTNTNSPLRVCSKASATTINSDLGGPIDLVFADQLSLLRRRIEPSPQAWLIYPQGQHDIARRRCLQRHIGQRHRAVPAQIALEPQHPRQRCHGEPREIT